MDESRGARLPPVVLEISIFVLKSTQNLLFLSAEFIRITCYSLAHPHPWMRVPGSATDATEDCGMIPGLRVAIDGCKRFSGCRDIEQYAGHATLRD